MGIGATKNTFTVNIQLAPTLKMKEICPGGNNKVIIYFLIS